MTAANHRDDERPPLPSNQGHQTTSGAGGGSERRLAARPARIDQHEGEAEFTDRFHPRPEPPAPEPAPHRRPRAAAPRQSGRARREGHRLAFVLHAHLPWVLGHGSWPHGEDWLAEAVVHCYVPLLDLLERAAQGGRRDLLTVSVTPVLAAQLADPRTPRLVDAWLAARLEAARGSARRHPLAEWWQTEYERLVALWQGIDRDPIAALARLGRSGVIELATSAATHPYLPLAPSERLVRLALGTGVDLHRRLFGSAPLGCWMPECAYRPGGAWRHPVTGLAEPSRAGNEAFLAEQGLRWTVVDSHLLPGQTGPGPDPVAIGESGVAAFARDPHAAAQVWSRQGGYPGDGRFLDFHKRHSPSGLRFWRVTDPNADLGDKLPYWPVEAREAVANQARHFVDLVASDTELEGGVAVCPFDCELFGHWWYEGPAWLEEVLALTAPGSSVTTTTPARALAEAPLEQSVSLSEGSWGAGGDHQVWLNPGTDWIWRELTSCEAEAFSEVFTPGAPLPWRRAALVQLLLLAASDWPFLITVGTARDYAEERFRLHRDRLRALLASGPWGPLPDWASSDLAFPDLDPAWAFWPPAS